MRKQTRHQPWTLALRLLVALSVLVSLALHPALTRAALGKPRPQASLRLGTEQFATLAAIDRVAKPFRAPEFKGKSDAAGLGRAFWLQVPRHFVRAVPARSTAPCPPLFSPTRRRIPRMGSEEPPR